MSLANERIDGRGNPYVINSDRNYPHNFDSLNINVSHALDTTLNDLLGESNNVLKRLITLRRNTDLFLGLDSDADNRIVHSFGVLMDEISKHINSISETGKKGRSNRLSDQIAHIRDEAVQLYLTVRRLTLLMNAKSQCGDRNLSIFLSAIETLALEFELNISNKPNSAPLMHYFFFEDYLPNIVPEEGGWLYLVGTRLWKDEKPEVSLIDPDKRITLAKLDVNQVVGIDDIVAVKMESDWILENLGRCLHLRLSQKKTSKTLWEKLEESQTAYSYLPICIPQSYGSQYKIAGFMEYQTKTKIRLLKSKSIIFENSSCIDHKQVSQTQAWSLEQGEQLIETGETFLYEVGASSIDCKIIENRIICSGNLEHAICSQDISVEESPDNQNQFIKQSVWEHIFTPIAESPVEEDHYSWELSKSINIMQPGTEIAVLLAREGPSEKTTIWYEIVIVNGGQNKTLLISPKQTLLGKKREDFLIGHDHIIADIDPAPHNDMAEIRMRIESPICPY